MAEKSVPQKPIAATVPNPSTEPVAPKQKIALEIAVPNQDDGVVCAVCGHKNTKDAGLCAMCSNYLFD